MLVWVKNNLHHNYMFQYPIIYWKLISLGLTCTNRHNRSLDYSSGPHTDLILGVVPNCLSWTEVQIPIFCNSFALHHSQKIRFPPRLDSWLMDLLHEATLAAILFSFSNYLLGFAWSASLHRLFFFFESWLEILELSKTISDTCDDHTISGECPWISWQLVLVNEVSRPQVLLARDKSKGLLLRKILYIYKKKMPSDDHQLCFICLEYAYCIFFLTPYKSERFWILWGRKWDGTASWLVILCLLNHSFLYIWMFMGRREH